MEWLNYHHLYYFWLVCKEGGFSKASKRLRIAQSAVSIQVAKLEDFLGAKLMERSSRGFTLTEPGQIAFERAEEIFNQGLDLVQYFRSGKMKESFRVGAVSGLSKNLQLKLLMPIVTDTSVEVSLEVGDSAALLERLVNYKLDAVLSDAPFASSEADPLTQIEIATEPVCLITSLRPKKNSSQIKIGEFLKNGVYLPAKSSPMTSALLANLREENSELIVRGYIDDVALLRLLAIETKALVAIPKIGVRRELEERRLFIVHEFRKIRQSYFLIHRQRGKRHPMLEHLVGD